jgi:hypothetical protein
MYKHHIFLIHSSGQLGSFHSLAIVNNPAIDFFETDSHYVAQAGLELKILLPLPPEFQDYRCVPPSPA